jgi:polyisoprenoid-binding protein YceI
MPLRPAIALLVILAVLSACTPTPRVEPPQTTGVPPQFPGDAYEQAARAGERVYRVDPAQSRIVVYVRADGPLAGTLGHSHVISTNRIHGYVLPAEDSGGQGDFYIALSDLVVDDPQLRAAAGFDGGPSTDQIEGTRRNMHKVLETQRFPYALLHLRPVRRPDIGEALAGTLTLHGRREPVVIPARITRSPTSVTATGTFRITHHQFGMTPYSVLGGALRVRDEIEIRFDVHASPFALKARRRGDPTLGMKWESNDRNGKVHTKKPG